MRGIYEIRNLATGESYIGLAQSITTRWKHHKERLRAGQHLNHRLQQAWDARGEMGFDWRVLEEIPYPGNLHAAEKHWIERLAPAYNIAEPFIEKEKPRLVVEARPRRDPRERYEVGKIKSDDNVWYPVMSRPPAILEIRGDYIALCPCCNKPTHVLIEDGVTVLSHVDDMEGD